MSVSMSVRIRLRAFLSAVHGIQRSPKYNIELLTTGRRPRKLKESGMVIVIVTHFLFTEMSKKNKYTNADNLLSIINLCYIIEPPTEKELQLISTLYQTYIDKNNIEEYCITTLWVSTIYYIENIPIKIKRQKTWP